MTTSPTTLQSIYTYSKGYINQGFNVQFGDTQIPVTLPYVSGNSIIYNAPVSQSTPTTSMTISTTVDPQHYTGPQEVNVSFTRSSGYDLSQFGIIPQ